MDPYTLYTLLTLASVGKAGMIVLVAPQYPGRITRAMHSWALGGLMMGMNFALVVLAARDLVPGPVALGGAATLGIGGTILVFVAVQELRERIYSRFTLLGVFLFTAVSNACTLYAGYNKLRIITNSALAAAVFFMITYALLRSAPPSGRSIYRVTGVLALAISVVLAIRAVNPLILGSPIVHPMDENWVQQLTYSAILIGNLLGSLCFGLIVAEELNAELHQLASFDSLTRIYNRRVFENLATEELLRARTKREPVSLLMIDIDHFKQVNDRYGHAAGDAALVRVAETMEESLRHRDLFCRYGGEEFGVLLPATAQELAQRIADRLRFATMRAGFRYGEEDIPLTVSIGVACIDRPPYDLSLIKHNADRALYIAKQTGRNRVAVV
ncbi:GGDEF domain-containing protein [Methylococcus mesophilus]|uniref:GGDEF domain-containing protein n=1 Tax=Methylococcus mesophilus TaxID=2993564 RepID=UPI00224AAC56|nr:GGDEF domain-containing protein [Methylococcus mesophilus]UZR30829.1 GGDEF domain-containing protein [Methylococcus mesophilus]